MEIKIEELTEERKALIKGLFRDRHFNVGFILLGLGVLESVGGALNTWFRTGKLFPGPVPALRGGRRCDGWGPGGINAEARQPVG